MAKPRGRETVSDMVRSLAVVGAVVAALFLVVFWQRPEGQGAGVRSPADGSGVVAAVEATGPFDVLAPRALGPGWEETSAWYEPDDAEVDGAVLHLGYLTPSGSYAEVRQTDGERSDAVSGWTDDGVPTGETVELSGLAWERLEAEESGRLALVSERTTSDGPVVLVVTGKAGWDELEELAASLR
jgi:hypothetical protein